MNRSLFLLEQAVALLSAIPSRGSYADLTDYFQDSFTVSPRVPADSPFDAARINRLVPEDIDHEQIAKNLFIVYVLVYLFTGKYPEHIWGRDVIEQESVISEYRHIRDAYIASCSALHIPGDIQWVNDKTLAFFEDGICGGLTRRFLDVSDMQCVNIAEDLTMAAILKQRHFIPKVASPARWIDRMREEIERLRRIDESLAAPRFRSVGQRRTAPDETPTAPPNGIVRVMESAETQDWELHAMSVLGTNHQKCDDDSTVCTLGDGAWFAGVADGVGSAPLSHVGSRIALEVVREVLERAYRVGGDPFVPGRGGERDGLMHFIQFDLGRYVSELWRKRVTAYIEKQEPREDMDVNACASTLLFSFGCRELIACGILGDGKFIVEKRKKRRDGKIRHGYFFLTDGYSDVVKTTVLHMEHLHVSPEALHIAFFRPNEVSGIFMASDGANAIEYRNTGGVLNARQSSPLNAIPMMDELRACTPEACEAHVRDMCLRFSASNMYAGGRGDDCSIVYIKHRFNNN